MYFNCLAQQCVAKKELIVDELLVKEAGVDILEQKNGSLLLNGRRIDKILKQN